MRIVFRGRPLVRICTSDKIDKNNTFMVLFFITLTIKI